MRRALVMTAVVLSLAAFVGILGFNQVNPYDKRTNVEQTYASIIAMREMFNIATKTQIELEDLEFLDMIFSARQLATPVSYTHLRAHET